MQNTSSAVMQQRAEPHDSLDDFPTQPWATRALLKHVIVPAHGDVQGLTAWEPACNRGHMVKPLRESFRQVFASDVFDYGSGERVVDFLWPSSAPDDPVDWIITNPPFRLAQQFIARGLSVAQVGMAVIVRTAFLEGVGRWRDLFNITPPTIVAQFTERVPMVKGRLTATGSTATAYCWLVWIKGAEPRPFAWIPPCRKQLERPGDYPEGNPSGD